MNDLQEAPASVTYSITSQGGFNALFTIREMTGLGLLEKMTVIEKKLTDMGYKPQIKPAFGQKKELEYADYPCPKCGSKVVKSTTATGKKLEKCETQKFINNQKSGCEYTLWL